MADVVTSMVNAVSNVPDGLATALMVGVNPIHGLYSTILGPTIGSLISSSQIMLVATTVAASVFAGQAISGLPEEQRLTGLFTFTVLAGIFLMLFGFLKFGRLSKFISYPVMRGFMYGVGVLLILGQFNGLVGYATFILIGNFFALWRLRKSYRRTNLQNYIEGQVSVPVSVLVPAYNEAETILSTIHNLLIADFKRYEIVVIDDGSTDCG